MGQDEKVLNEMLAFMLVL